MAERLLPLFMDEPQITKEDWLVVTLKLIPKQEDKEELAAQKVEDIIRTISTADATIQDKVLRYVIQKRCMNVALRNMSIEATTAAEIRGVQELFEAFKSKLVEQGTRVTIVRKVNTLPNEVKMLICEHLVTLFPTVSLNASPRAYASRLGGNAAFQLSVEKAMIQNAFVRLPIMIWKYLEDAGAWKAAKYVEIMLNGTFTVNAREILHAGSLFDQLKVMKVTWTRSDITPIENHHVAIGVSSYQRIQDSIWRKESCFIKADNGVLDFNSVSEALNGMNWDIVREHETGDDQVMSLM